MICIRLLVVCLAGATASPHTPRDVNTSIQPLKDLPMDQYVKFFLFTRSNPHNYQVLSVDNSTSVSSSNFNPAHNTTIVVHGFMSNILSDLNVYIKNDMLALEEHNVIGVDWSAIAETILYSVAVAETRPVGQYVARFVDFMVGQGLRLARVHLVGHSLGAHIVGFAGASVSSGTLPRITGLDPAKPGFESAGASGRLDASDAQLVDCIHTCAGNLGLGKPVCSADYYPNGGENMQPGCPWYDFGACSHTRSYEYYAESIKPGHLFRAMVCAQVPIEGPGSCSHSDALMGYPASPRNLGYYYVITNDQYPFSRN